MRLVIFWQPSDLQISTNTTTACVNILVCFCMRPLLCLLSNSSRSAVIRQLYLYGIYLFVYLHVCIARLSVKPLSQAISTACCIYNCTKFAVTIFRDQWLNYISVLGPFEGNRLEPSALDSSVRTCTLTHEIQQCNFSWSIRNWGALSVERKNAAWGVLQKQKERRNRVKAGEKKS